VDHHRTIHLTVNYTGKEPFREAVHDNPTFHELKLMAMRAFGLELPAAAKYVLQYNGTDLDDQRHIESLDEKHVVLQLTLKHEPVKGGM